MSFPRTNPLGKALFEELLSTEYNDIDLKTSLATDGRKNSDELPALNLVKWDLVVGSNQIRDVFWDPIARQFIWIEEQSTQTNVNLRGGVGGGVITGSALLDASVHFFNGSENSATTVILSGDGGAVKRGNFNQDGSQSWSNASTPPSDVCGKPGYAWVTDIWVLPSTAGGAWWSNDDGDTWSVAATPPSSSSSAPMVTDGTRFVLGFVGAGGNELYWSDDGDTWNTETLPNTINGNATLARTPTIATTPKWICAGYNTSDAGVRIFHSDDAETWSAVAFHEFGSGTQPKMMGFVSGVLVMLISDGSSDYKIMASSDLGLSWSYIGDHLLNLGTDAVTKLFDNPFQPNILLSASDLVSNSYNQSLLATLRGQLT